MTVAKETARSGPYIGNGVSTSFAYRFRVNDKRHLRVVKTETATDVESLLELDVDYSVTGVGNALGGAVVLKTALPATHNLVIVRDEPFIQSMDLVNQGPFFPEDVEGSFDKSVFRDQELAEKLSRAVTVPLGDSTDPKDYLAQIKAILAAVLAAAAGGSEVSVLTQGAAGDKETNDRAAFQAARDRAVELGLDYVLVPITPDPDDYYLVVGDIDGVADVRWIFDPRAAVNGSTNLFGLQQKITGARFWEPTVGNVVLKDNDNRYSHQAQVGTDLDGEWLVTCQYHPTLRREGSDGQLVGVFKSTDGDGDVFTDIIPFATDATYSENPIQDVEPVGQPFSLWRTGVLNFYEHGLGFKLALRFDMTLGSTQGGGWLAFKFAADGKYTNYGFFQTDDGVIRLYKYGDTLPADATWLIRHEGRDDYFPYCHGDYFSADGTRLHLLWVLSPRFGGGQANQRKKLCILYCDNPGVADPEDMVWTLGPSVPLGDMDPHTLWEYSISEEGAPGHYILEARRNEREGSVLEQEGRRHYFAEGDGVSFPTGMHPSGIHAHRDRPQLVRLNHVHTAYITLDEPNSRSNTAVWLKRPDAGIAPAFRVSDNTPFTRERDETLTFESQGDSVVQSTQDFTDKRVDATLWRSSGERVELADDGYLANYDDQTIDLQHIDGFSVGNTIVGFQDYREETLYPTTSPETFFLDFDLTKAPVILNFGDAGAGSLAIGSGGMVIDTANDIGIFQGTLADNQTLVLAQWETAALKIIASANDTVWDISADTSLTLAAGSFGLVMIGDAGEQRDIVKPLEFLPNTAASQVTVYADHSLDDRLIPDLRGGDQEHVPTGWRNPTSGDLGVAYATNKMATEPGVGGTGIRFARIGWEAFPRTDALNVIPRQNARPEDGSGHVWVWDEDTGIVELKGKTSCGVDLPAGRHMVSGRFRLSELPLGFDRARILQVGNFETRAHLDLDWRSPNLLRALYLVDAAGGARDLQVSAPITQDKVYGVTYDEMTGTYSLDDDVWLGFSFRYDSFRGELTIEGKTFPLQWPYTLLLGDGDLVSQAPTTRSLFFDILGAQPLTALEIPETCRVWDRAPAASEAPNMFLDPGCLVERERLGANFPVDTPRANLPGWAVVDDGYCTVRVRQTESSIVAANRALGGWPFGMAVEVSNAVKSPEALATGAVSFMHTWPDIFAFADRPWYLMFDAIDDLDEEADNAARDIGLPIRLFWVQDFGAGSFRQDNEPLFPIRVFRYRQRYGLPLPLPLVDERNNAIVGPGSFCGLRFDVQPGWNCNLTLGRFDLYRGNGPRAWSPPQPYDLDRTRKLYFDLSAKRIGGVIGHGRMVDASTAELLVNFPVEMEREPSLRDIGTFAIEHGGSLYTATDVDLQSATENLALIHFNAESQTLDVDDAVAIKGISKLTQEKTGDGVVRNITLADYFEVEHEDDLAVIRQGSGGDSTLTLDTDYDVRPSRTNETDWLIPTSGQPTFVVGMSLNNISALDVVHWTEASGEETLTAGTGNGFVGQLGASNATITLIDSSGTAVNAVSGDDYRGVASRLTTFAEVLLGTPVPDSAIDLVQSAVQSDAALQFDARPFRPSWTRRAQTNTLYDAFSTAPGDWHRQIMDRAIGSLLDEGLWTALDLLYLFAAPDQQGALLNWKTPASFAGTATNSPIFNANRGFSFDGVSSYADTGFTPTTHASALQQNDGSLGVWCWSAADDAPVAGNTTGSGRISITPKTAAGLVNYRINSTTLSNDTAIRASAPQGYFATDRAAAGAQQFYAEGINGNSRVVADAAAASTGLPSASLTIGRINGSTYGQCEIAAFWVGASFSALEHRKMRRILERYLIDVGAL